MADQILDSIPRQIAQGDSFELKKLNAAYPVSEWSLSLIFRSTTPVVVAADAEHKVTVTAEHTMALDVANIAVLFVYTAISGGQKRSVPMGSCNVLSDPTATPTKSWAQQTLDQVQEAIQKLTTKTLKVVRVNGEEFVFADIDQLLKMRNQLLGEVATEQTREGMKPVSGSSKRIRTRFK